MPPRFRRLALTVHVGVSVGWVGAVVAYLALDIAVATGQDAAVLRAGYVGMELVATRAIVPLAVASLATGVLMAVGTPWGLFRHYWVLVSLLLTVVATVVLLVETQTTRFLAMTAVDPAASAGDLRALEHTLAHSVGGLLVLLVVLVLNMYKPRGMTRYGWRKQQEQQERAKSQRRWRVTL